MNNIQASLLRAEKILSVYRKENGIAGNDFSHIRDLIIDLLHYLDTKDIGTSYELLEIAADIFSQEKVEFCENP
jgi:hypothetical protein